MGHSWLRAPNTLHVMKIPYIVYSSFLKFCPTPLRCYLKSSPPLIFLMRCLVDWMADSAILMCYFTSWSYGSINIGPWYVRTRTILLCVLYNKASNLLWSDTQYDSLVLWLDITYTHTQKDTQHAQGSIDWHTHINIYKHYLPCAHSSYL